MATSPPDRSDWFAVRTRGALDAAVRPPGSKSLTNRALAIAALARGESNVSDGNICLQVNKVAWPTLRVYSGGNKPLRLLRLFIFQNCFRF